VRCDPFLLLLQAHGLPLPQTEYPFAPPRRWRADYCWPDLRLIVEKDGGLFRGGRRPGTAVGGHSSAAGILRDMEKSNAAQLLGYRYLRFAPRELDSGAALPMIRQALTGGIGGAACG
jgi:very-short-patch-repair endonuclease